MVAQFITRDEKCRPRACICVFVFFSIKTCNFNSYALILYCILKLPFASSVEDNAHKVKALKHPRRAPSHCRCLILLITFVRFILYQILFSSIFASLHN